MTEAEQSKEINQLKRLRGKAELCRYAHERMKASACFWKGGSEIVVASLSFFLSVLLIMLYRDILPGNNNMWLIILAVLTPLILLIQSVSGIFRLVDKESQSGIAIHIWGQWIREADFFEKEILDISEKETHKKMTEMGEKYVTCMEKTPPIPTRKFLCYKIEYLQQRRLSKKMDNANNDELVDIGRELGCTKPGKH